MKTPFDDRVRAAQEVFDRLMRVRSVTHAIDGDQDAMLAECLAAQNKLTKEEDMRNSYLEWKERNGAKRSRGW